MRSIEITRAGNQPISDQLGGMRRGSTMPIFEQPIFVQCAS
jgi:hypothetical protein